MGGIATYVHDLALGLKEIGHQVEVITLATDETNRVINYQGLLVHRVPWTNLLEDQQRLLTVMPYSHNILKQIIALSEQFLSIHRRDPFDVVEAPEMFAEGLFVALSKVAPIVVRLYTPHFKFIDEKFHNITTAFDHQFIGMLERLTMIAADVVTSPSEDLADYISRDMNYPRNNIPIVRDPIDTNKFCPEGDKTLSADGRLTVLFAGRLEARKGIYYLMEAIPKVVKVIPAARFVVIGRDTNTAKGKTSVLSIQKTLVGSRGLADSLCPVPLARNLRVF